jgi:hypothetical protein
MAGWRQAIELALSDEDIAALAASAAAALVNVVDILPSPEKLPITTAMSTRDPVLGYTLLKLSSV